VPFYDDYKFFSIPTLGLGALQDYPCLLGPNKQKIFGKKSTGKL